MERKLIIYEEYTMLLQMERINEVYWNQNLKYLDDNNNVRGPHPSVVGFFNDRQGNLGTTLDLGCNYGRHFHYLTGEEINVHGVDIASDVIEKVQEESLKRYGNDFPTGERLKCASMLSLPFTDNFFDTVVAWGVFHQSTPLGGMLGLEESYSVLNSGGIMYGSVRTDNLLPDGKMREGTYFSYNVLPQRTFYEPKEFMETARSIGFESGFFADGEFVPYRSINAMQNYTILPPQAGRTDSRIVFTFRKNPELKRLEVIVEGR